MEHRRYRAASREYDVTFYFAFDWRREASWNFADYRIPATTFWYVLEGSRVLRTPWTEVRLEPGMLAALPAHLSVSTHHGGEAKAPIRYLSMGVQAVAGGLDWIERYGIPLAMRVAERRELRELIRLWGELQEETAAFRSRPSAEAERDAARDAGRLSAHHTARALAWEGKVKLWLSLLTQITLPHMSTPNPIVDPRVGEICTYIRRNYSRPIQADALAKRVLLSEGHMRAIFREAMGMSPHQYVLHIRIEKAKELLAAGALPLADIAAMTGFEDVGYFIQMFKKREGQTPSSFRKRAGAWEE